MTTKCTKLPQNLPIGRKIYQMAIKYTNIKRPCKIYPKWDFWFENIQSGNPGTGWPDESAKISPKVRPNRYLSKIIHKVTVLNSGLKLGYPSKSQKTAPSKQSPSGKKSPNLVSLLMYINVYLQNCRTIFSVPSSTEKINKNGNFVLRIISPLQQSTKVSHKKVKPAHSILGLFSRLSLLRSGKTKLILAVAGNDADVGRLVGDAHRRAGFVEVPLLPKVTNIGLMIG
jgi:hypothetical protein